MDRVYTGDLEADGFLDTATKVWCGVFKNLDTGEKVKFHIGDNHYDYIDAMLCWLDGNVDVLIMHNGVGYDWPLLRRLYKYEFKGRKVDTLLMSRLQRPDRRSPPNCPNKIAPHSIEAWGYRLGRHKPDHNDWSKFSIEMLHRCEEDVEIQHETFKALLVEGRGQKWRNAHMMTLKLFERLQLSEEYGWLVDREHMDNCIRMLDRWIALIDRAVSPHLPIIVEVDEIKKNGEYSYVSKPFKKDGTLSKQAISWGVGYDNADRVGDINDGFNIVGPFSRITFRKVDLDSNLETKNFLLKEGWEPKEWNYNEAGDKTSPKLSKDDPFEGVNKGVGKLVAKRVQCRHRRSTISGLIDLIRPDGRISAVVSGIATTGRAKHAGIVNIPRATSFFGKQMRRIFIAKPGWVLVGTDSDACQVRMLAARMGEETFTNAVLHGKKEDGTDTHSLVMKAAELKNRDEGKKLFFTVVFGAGDEKAGKVLSGGAKEGAEAKAKLFNKMPALKQLISKLNIEWKNNSKKRFIPKWGNVQYYDGWVEGLDGRPIFINSEHAVLVYVIQADEAIMMSLAYLKFHQWMEKYRYKWIEDYGTVCWYHDEFTVECRPEIAKHVAELAEQSIEWAGKYLKIKCPHKGDATIGNNWAEVH